MTPCQVYYKLNEATEIKGAGVYHVGPNETEARRMLEIGWTVVRPGASPAPFSVSIWRISGITVRHSSSILGGEFTEDEDVWRDTVSKAEERRRSTMRANGRRAGSSYTKLLPELPQSKHDAGEVVITQGPIYARSSTGERTGRRLERACMMDRRGAYLASERAVRGKRVTFGLAVWEPRRGPWGALPCVYGGTTFWPAHPFGRWLVTSDETEDMLNRFGRLRWVKKEEATFPAWSDVEVDTVVWSIEELKKSYTKRWGMMACPGVWVGSKNIDVRKAAGTDRYGISWVWIDNQQYRPLWAAAIAWDNLIRTSCRALETQAVATHIDCVIIPESSYDTVSWDGWTKKADGMVTIRGVGNWTWYDAGGKKIREAAMLAGNACAESAWEPNGEARAVPFGQRVVPIMEEDHDFSAKGIVGTLTHIPQEQPEDARLILLDEWDEIVAARRS